jgi:hypothetical protein
MSRRGKDRTVRWLQEQTGGRYQELHRLKRKFGAMALELARQAEPDDRQAGRKAYDRILLQMVKDYWKAKAQG